MSTPTKAQLLEEARDLGLDVNKSMTNPEIQDQIDAARAVDEDEAEPVEDEAETPSSTLEGSTTHLQNVHRDPELPNSDLRRDTTHFENLDRPTGSTLDSKF